jgi:hypothetical protein
MDSLVNKKRSHRLFSVRAEGVRPRFEPVHLPNTSQTPFHSILICVINVLLDVVYLLRLLSNHSINTVIDRELNKTVEQLSTII